MIAGYYRSRI